MLHIDPWPSRESETHSGRRSRDLIGSYGRYEIIYVDACLSVKELVWARAESESRCSHWERSAGAYGPHWASSWVSPAEKQMKCCGVIKITQHAMAMTRSTYVSVKQSVFVSLSPSVSLSHTIEDLTPYGRIKRRIYFYNQVLRFSHHGIQPVGSVWIRIVFPFIIHSSILASSRYLFSCSDYLLRMDMNF